MKKGFTLVELLGVITLLAIIAVIVMPTVSDTLNKSKEKTLKEQKQTIITAAKRWGTDNTQKLPDTSCDIKVDSLKTEGYLSSKKEIKDPTTGNKMDGCVRITKDPSYNQYKYTYVETCGRNIC